MPIFDFLRSLATKKQTTPEKWLDSSVRIVTAGQQGAQKPPFSHERAVNLFRSWIYAAASINANAVASTPLRLYAKKGAGKKLFRTRGVSRVRKSYMLGDGHGDQRPSLSVLRKVADFGDELEEVTEMHPIIELLSTCNPFLNGFDSTVLRVLYGELTGNAYLHPVIDQETGMPAELWPLAPQYTEVIPDEDSFIRGYLYGVDASKKQVFGRDEVIHFRRPNPGNLYYGLGKIEAAYGAVLSNQAVHDMDLATFQNSARPDYAVVVRGTPTSDQLDRFQEQVEQRLRGTRKDGNFIAVTGDVQFTPLNFPPKDIVGREDIVEEIAAVFGVPVTMLKSNDPNLASSKTGFAQWREGTVLPLIRMDEEELNQTLLPLFGLEDELVLCYDNPVPSDKAYELQERQAAVSGGWRTPNEARLEEGKDPVEDNEYADQLLINGQPLGAAAQQQAPGGAGGFQFMDQIFGGGERGGSMQPAEPKDPTEQSPDVDFASKVLGAVRTRSLARYSAIKLIQGAGFSRAVAEKMVDAEDESAPQTKVERREGESLDACVARGIETLIGEGYEREQAIAMAFQMCGQKAMNLDESEDKCPGDDCDDCGHSEKPRPKAFRLRPTLDGASTEAIVKAWDRWGLIVKDQPDDCGTGAGGFKEGNVCATGESAGGSTWKGTGSITDDDRQFIDSLRKKYPVGDTEQVEISALSGDELDELGRRIAQMNEQAAVETIRGLVGKGKMPWHTLDGMTWDQVSTLEEIEMIASGRKWKSYMDGSLPFGYGYPSLHRLLTATLDAQGLTVFQHESLRSRIGALVAGADPEAVSELNYQINKATRLVENSSWLMNAEAIRTAMGGNDVSPQTAIPFYDSMYTGEQKALYNAAYQLALTQYERTSHSDGIGWSGYKMSPSEMFEDSVKMAQAWNVRFAEKGLAVRVDPGVFMPPFFEGGMTDEHQQEALFNLTHGYAELLGIDRGLDRIIEAGHEIDHIQMGVYRREDFNTTAFMWNPEELSSDMGTQAFWRNSVGDITTMVDRHVNPWIEFGKDGARKSAQWSVTAQHGEMGTFVHEMGHAIHSRNIKVTGASYFNNKVLDFAGERLNEKFSDVDWNPGKVEAAIDTWLGRTRETVSKYGRTAAVEFVAEAFTMKTLSPQTWESIKDNKVWTSSDITPEERKYGLTQELLEDMTYEELYELLGGA